MNTIFLWDDFFSLCYFLKLRAQTIQFIPFHNPMRTVKRNEMKWNECMMIRESQCHWSKSIVLVNQVLCVCASAHPRQLFVSFSIEFSIPFGVCWIHISFWWCICLRVCALRCRAAHSAIIYAFYISQFFSLSMTRTWMNEWQTT